MYGVLFTDINPNGVKDALFAVPLSCKAVSIYMSRVMREPTFCKCENKDVDRSLCFRYINSTIPLLSQSEYSSLLPSSVAVQPGLCKTRSETRTLVFS